MTMSRTALLFILAALFAAESLALGQSTLQVSVTAAGKTSNVTPGGTLSLTANDTGQAVLANVTVLYTGTPTAVITAVSITGTSEMSLLALPAVPLTLNPGGSTSFTIQYLPSSGNAVNAQVSIGFTENSQASAFTFGVTGSAPRLTFSYFFSPSGSLTDLNAGDRITFPATNVGSSAQAVITVLNRGTAAASLQSINVSGSTFQLNGSPAPIQLQPGQQASFNVTFAPQAMGGSQGLLALGFASSSATFSLAGTGTSTAFSVSYTLADGNLHPLSSGTAIAFPSVDINGTSTATITILNQGTGPGSVTGIAIAGSGFQLTGLPLMPATVPAGQSLRFSIVFAPTQTGAFNGTFRIDFAGSSLSGTLIGSTNPANFTFTYSLADGNLHPLVSGTLISFSTIDVSKTTTANITILNQGSGTGTVTGISVAGVGFQVSGTPLLPATVPAGQSLRFGIVFAPTQTGTFSGTFTVTTTGTTISGSLVGSTTAPNFSASYTFGNNTVSTLSPGSMINFPAIDINGTATAAITILNDGPGAGTVNNIAVSGTGFQLTGTPAFPATVSAGQSLHFSVVFAPTQSGTFNGTFRIDLTGGSFSGSLSGTTASSNISFAYVDPDTNNTIPLSNNSTLPFPNTLSGTVSTITVLLTNSGAGTGTLNSVTLGSNTSFQLVNLPSLPAAVPPSQQVRFGIRFTPAQQQAFSTTLLVSINGQVTTINLAAQGTGPQFTYACTNGNGTTALVTGGTLAMADTSVGQTTTVTLSITNSGTGDGQISSVNLTGLGLALSGLPAVPFTLHPNASQQFTVTFAPQQPGPVTGRLTIGADSFGITATGIGSKLTYSYANTAAATAVVEGGTAIFAPIPVGNTESLSFSVQNTGTSPATISSINLTAPSSMFSLHQLPSLPMNLNPGASITFAASFLPNNTGTLTATLAINTSTFTLSGTGTQPGALPDYQFHGPSGDPQPAQQTGIGLTLSAPYPLPLRGVLTLTFASSVFTDDPAIQFANGARTISFTIPTNTTQALFNGTSTSVPLQTGTTAGTMTITPSFTMQSGFDLTPASPNVLDLTIQRAAPQLVSASVTSETSSSFTLILTGYATTRTARQLDIQVNPKQGQSFSSTHLTIDVSSAAASWFEGAASQGFGGTFQVAVPFVLQNGSSTGDLVHLLQTLTITMTNDLGTSNAISVPIP
jgi:hypothetical protein